VAAQSIARSALLLSALWVAACAARAPADPDPPPDASRTAPLVAALDRAAHEQPRARGALAVRLAFGAAADLDLYVTDPLGETVYFANTPSHAGGALDADRGCADAAPRVETVVFPHPPSGRYRVGVDYAKSCNGRGDPAGYALMAEREGGAVETRTGAVAAARFEPIALELDAR
jgi:hypothetical protein